MSNRRLLAVLAGQPLVVPRIQEVVPFGEYRPDAPDLSGFAIEALNVLPFGPFGYRPFKAFSAYSTGALSARCQGAAAMPDTEGATFAYAGDATKLYRLVDLTWTDASGTTYTIGLDDTWQIGKIGTRVIAANLNDEVQGMAVGGTTFADQITSTLKPRCRTFAQVTSRFFMLGSTIETGTRTPNRYRWGQIDSLVNFDESAANQSDKRDVAEHLGTIQRLFGGDVGYGFHQRGIVRVTYEGSPTVFRFDVVEENHGVLAPLSVVRIGRMFFALSHQGFVAFDGFTAQLIGANKVDQYFFDNIHTSYYHRISMAVDPVAKVLYCAFPSTSVSSPGNPDTILFYHWPSGWWARASITTVILVDRDLTKGYSLETLDTVSTSIDDLPFSLDSPTWTGGILQVGAFDTTHNSGTFTGSNLAATIDTTAKQIMPGRRSLVSGAHPIVDGGTITLAVAGKQKMTEATSYGTARSQATSGKVPLRKRAMFHQFRAVIAAGGSWTHAQGVQPIASPAGER